MQRSDYLCRYLSEALLVQAPILTLILICESVLMSSVVQPAACHDTRHVV
jgi:hypothetical protein